jgi:hypothetical protein
MMKLLSFVRTFSDGISPRVSSQLNGEQCSRRLPGSLLDCSPGPYGQCFARFVALHDSGATCCTVPVAGLLGFPERLDFRHAKFAVFLVGKFL